MMRVLSVILVIAFIGIGCEDEPELSSIPSLEVRSISPSQVTSFKDSIVVELFYQDGNGDLGFYSGDDLSLEVTDSRNGLIEKYYVPPLAPQGEEIAIQGTFRLEIPFTFILDQNNNSEMLSYSIRIMDRAGNWSERVETAQIEVVP